MPYCKAMIDHDAYVLREGTGTSGVIETARLAAGRLADHLIPHLIVGGLAVQEYGYRRMTLDVDIVVPDVLDALEILTADVTGPLYRLPGGIEDRIQDRRSETMIDLLPAGKVLKQGCKVPFPMPTVASDLLQIVGLEKLISLKLDSWSNSRLRRSRDMSDVIEIILRRKLPRDLAVDPAVLQSYLEIWDGLKAEK
jgi:hypothetical protein